MVELEIAVISGFNRIEDQSKLTVGSEFLAVMQGPHLIAEKRESKKYKGKIFYLKLKIKIIICNNNLIRKIGKIYKNYVEYFLWRFKIAVRSKRNVLAFDRIYWVSPHDISYCTLKEFNPYKYYGVVMVGNWDQLCKEFEKLDVFIALKSRFLNDTKWEDTEYYHNIINRIKNGQYCWGCKSENEFIARCKRLDDLYNDIMINGYKTQTDISLSCKGKKKYDEISINIGRNGEFLFNNGAHRLSIAKTLNIDKVPIRITVCHKNVLNCQRTFDRVVTRLNQK